MRLYPPELEIGDLEGFTPERDIFGRAALGKSLTHLVSSVSDPTVIALDAPWGAGKTVFLKMWAGELRQAGFAVVYFDAFKNDFAEDAFTALASEIVELVEERHKAATPAGKQFLAKALGAGKILLRGGLRLGVKVATLSALDTKDLEQVVVAAADEFSGLADTYVGSLLTRQKEHKAAFEAFRDALAALPALLAKNDAKDDRPPPLVLIVDELDRCRPVFALELMERMKHFFSVPNVHFVLGTNLGQLRNSVVAAYGSGIDAQTYLQKFIHLTVSLTDAARHDHERVVPKFLHYLRSALEFRAEDRQFVDEAIVFIRFVAEGRNLSLRTLERIMSRLSLGIASTPSSFLRLPPIIAGLCILTVVDPGLYAKARAGAITFKEVAPALYLDAPLTRDGDAIHWNQKWWRFCTDIECTDEEVRELTGILARYSMEDRFKIVAWTASNIVDRLAPLQP